MNSLLRSIRRSASTGQSLLVSETRRSIIRAGVPIRARPRRRLSLAIDQRASHFVARPGTLEHWLAERYCLYAVDGQGIFSADIHHLPWPLQPAEAEFSVNEIVSASGFRLPDTPPILHYAERVDVATWPLKRVRLEQLNEPSVSHPVFICGHLWQIFSIEPIEDPDGTQKMNSYHLGFPVKVIGTPLRSHDSRRWQNEPHLSVSLAYLRDIFTYLHSRADSLLPAGRPARALPDPSADASVPPSDRRVRHRVGGHRRSGASIWHSPLHSPALITSR